MQREANLMASDIGDTNPIKEEQFRQNYNQYARDTEGFDIAAGDWGTYQKQKLDAVHSGFRHKRYADQARQAELESYYEDHYLPPVNYLGFSPEVDLGDLEAKVIKNESKDIHDFSLWEPQERELWRKPYLDPASEEIADWDNQNRSKSQIRQQLKNMLQSYGAKSVEIFMEDAPGSMNEYQLDLLHDRMDEAKQELRRQGKVR
jgi:hypothetical protein